MNGKRPNILILLSDQLRRQALSVYGDPDARTPHIEALATQGVRFSNACSTYPICVPFRFTMMTGEYAHTRAVPGIEYRMSPTERTLADWRQSLELARLLKQAEQSSSLDVAQAEGQVALAEADLEARRRALAQADNALQLLVGSELPGDLPAALPLERQSVIAQLPAGLPAELLLSRPDLRQAEQMLVAANADIGAARAAFFPQISLTASFGYASASLGGLFDSARQVWRFAPQISQPLFQGGRLRAELRLTEVRKSEAVAHYERAIQAAFREVADALAGIGTFERQIEAQMRAVTAAERRLQLSDLRYRAGVDGRLELLDAQRQLHAARQALLELRREEIANRVALYKSLGGGLHERDVTKTAAVAAAH